MVKIKFYSIIRMELGITEAEIEFSSGSLHQLLVETEKQIGKKFLAQLLDSDLKTIRGTIILLNGRNIVHLDGVKSNVQAGDELDIFPPGGGG